MTTAQQYALKHANRFRSELHELLRIPSVSTDKDYAAECKKAAEWTANQLASIGLSAEVIPTGRHPLVYAEWMGAGPDKPTVLIYGHYDVQPASKEDGWDTEPFEPVERDGKIWGRGTTDDKGQFFAHVKAVESLLQAEGKLPVNVKFIIEGEEESGGESIAKFVHDHPDRLAADVCVISDGSMANKGIPVIVYALRGITAFEVTVYGPKQDLHSGMFGGTVHNPAQALAEIISKLHKEDGTVAVPGFYDDVRILGDNERTELEKVPYTRQAWEADTGAPEPWGESDYTIQERIGARPTLEINGMASGYWGNGVKAIVPEKAWAKISCRLVADQDPATISKLCQDYIMAIAPTTVRVEIKQFAVGTSSPQVDIDTPMMQAAIRAYEKGWGAAPVFKREGGSLPIVGDFQKVLQIPVILMGFGLNTDGLHGPNEHMHIDMFHKGIDTSIVFLNEVAAL